MRPAAVALGVALAAAALLCALPAASAADELEPFFYQQLQADLPLAGVYAPLDAAGKADAQASSQPQAAFPFVAPRLPADLVRQASGIADPRFREIVAEQLSAEQQQTVQQQVLQRLTRPAALASVHEVARDALSLPSADQVMKEVAPNLKLAAKAPAAALLVESAASVSRAETQTEQKAEAKVDAKADAKAETQTEAKAEAKSSPALALTPLTADPSDASSPMGDAAQADSALQQEKASAPLKNIEADEARFASTPVPISNTNTVTTTTVNSGVAQTSSTTDATAPAASAGASAGASAAAAAAPASAAPGAAPAAAIASQSGSIADATTVVGASKAAEAAESADSDAGASASAMGASPAASTQTIVSASDQATDTSFSSLQLDSDPQIAALQKSVAEKESKLKESRAWVDKVREIVREYQHKLFNVNAHIHAEEREIRRTKKNIVDFIKRRNQRKLSLELQAALDALSKLEGDSSNIVEKVNKLHASRAALRATVRRLRLALGRSASSSDTSFVETGETYTPMSDAEKHQVNEHAKNMLSSFLEQLDEVHPVVASALESKYDGKVPPIKHSVAAAKIDPFIKHELLEQELDKTLKETDELSQDLE